MSSKQTSYFTADPEHRAESEFDDMLARCVERTRSILPRAGLRNPRIGNARNQWLWCGDGYDWVMGFFSGQLWLCHQLSGDPAFAAAAQARRPQFRAILGNRRYQDHDIGFLFSLHSVANWKMTADREAREMGLEAARILLLRFREDGQYLQAWTPFGPDDQAQARFANGRMIADSMQNLALLHWAYAETGRTDFREVAELHAATSARHLVRDDGTSFHTFTFDPATGAPIKGETHQGHADDSCWSRGQAWLIHGFAQCYASTANPLWLETARRLAVKAEELLGGTDLPVWDFALSADVRHPIDSSAGAVMAAGLLLLADHTEEQEAARWRKLARRLLHGLIRACDLTTTPGTEGLLAHGAAFVSAGRSDTMLPYGDYYFMEALMREQGHRDFFW